MRKKLIVGVALSCLFAVPRLTAQDAKAKDDIPLPPPPIVVRAPDSAQWQIVYTYDKPPLPTPDPNAKHSKDERKVARTPDIQQVQVAKTGKVYHHEVAYDDGSSKDSWWINGIQVTHNKGQGGFFILSSQDSNDVNLDFSSSDFPDVNWVSASNYLGLDTIKGVKCFSFRKKISLLSKDIINLMGEQVAKSSEVDVTVWISVEARLPIRWATKGKTLNYVYIAPPVAPLIPPEEATRTVTVWQAERAQMLRPPPRP